MTLITTIINQNIRCIAGDQYFTGGNIFPPEKKKIFKIKDGILSFYNKTCFSICILLNESDYSTIPIEKFIEASYNELKDSIKIYPNDFMGIYYLNQRIADLYFIPFQLQFNICANNNEIENEIIDNQILKLLNKQVLFNPILNNGKIDTDYYNKLLDCFKSVCPDEISRINENTVVEILSNFYQKVFDNKVLNRNMIGGNLDVFYYNEDGKLIQKNDVIKSDLK